MTNKLKTKLIHILGTFKKKKLKCKNFTIISNNCFAGVFYRNNSLEYMSPTCGMFIMPKDYIKFIYNLKEYLNLELKEIKLEESKYKEYLEEIKYPGTIGRLNDVEIMFLHYKNFEEAKQKWKRRAKRVNFDNIIYKFNDQNNCDYEDLLKFEEFEAENKLCFTAKKYDNINSIIFTEFEKDGYIVNDSKEKIYKKYIDMYKYINERFGVNEKIRILTVLNNLNKCDGISSYVMNYYNKFDLSKIHMDFVVVSDNIDDEYRKKIKSKGGKIFYIKTPSLKSMIKDTKNIKNFLKEKSQEYDIIHSHVINSGYFFLKYAKKYGIKYRILHSHNTTLGSEQFIKKIRNIIMAKKAVSLSTNRFACSKEAGIYLFGNKSFDVIHNAIDVQAYIYNEKIREEYRKKLCLEDNIVLTHVGRLDTQKNHLFLVEAFKKVLDVNSKYKLLLVGTGILEEKIKNKIKELNIEDSVIILGVRSDVNNILSASDMFVFPSLFEGLGIVAIEAQTSDLPCVLSDKVPSIVGINSNVKFVELDLELWKDAILSTKLNMQRINKSDAIEKAGYSIDKEVKELENKYINLLDTIL